MNADPHDAMSTRKAAHRSDAQRNHARILQAAQTVLTESKDASLRSIAKQAAVGQGTLYRHFPHRQALLMELYHDDVRKLAEDVARLLNSHPPATALRLWFGRLALFARNGQGLADTLLAASSAGLPDQRAGLLISAATRLLNACTTAGVIRSDLSVGELLLLMSALWQAPTEANVPTPSLHLLDLIIEGLRPPPSVDQRDTVIGTHSALPRPISSKSTDERYVEEVVR